MSFTTLFPLFRFSPTEAASHRRPSMAQNLTALLKDLSPTSDLPLMGEADLPGLKKPLQLYLWRHSSTTLSDSIHLCIYTHGAGGTCASPGSTNLCQSMAGASICNNDRQLVVLGFDGSMNLTARSKSFVALIKWAGECSRVHTISLAGRSMGCRAAAIAAKECFHMPKLSGKLVLQSYPLVGAGKGRKDEERKQVLLDLPSKCSVLFESGSKDEMTPIDALRAVQTSMNAQTATVVILEADHGLQLSAGVAPRGSKSKLEEDIGSMAGKVAGEWLLDGLNGEEKLGEGTIEISTGADEQGEAQAATVTWSGFLQKESQTNEQQRAPPKKQRMEGESISSPRRSKRPKRSNG